MTKAVKIIGIIMLWLICLGMGFTVTAGIITAAEAQPVEAISPEVMEEALIRSVITEEEEIMLAQMVYGEDRASTFDKRAACIWSVFNRIDCEKEWGDCVKDVVKHSQFHGYYKGQRVEEWAIWLARDVALRYALEKNGIEDVGRTLPNDYYFMSAEGLGNKFRKKYRGSKDYWDWSLESPYNEEAIHARFGDCG